MLSRKMNPHAMDGDEEENEISTRKFISSFNF
jgi:hypothetical protein